MREEYKRRISKCCPEWPDVSAGGRLRGSSPSINMCNKEYSKDPVRTKVREAALREAGTGEETCLLVQSWSGFVGAHEISEYTWTFR